MRTKVEAASLLAVVKLLLAVSPRLAFRFAASSAVAHRTALPVTRLAEIVWGLGVIPLLRGTCLSRAITLYILARRGGADAVLRIGVRRDGRALAAHAWVEVDGGVVPAEDVSAYAPIWGTR